MRDLRAARGDLWEGKSGIGNDGGDYFFLISLPRELESGVSFVLCLAILWLFANFIVLNGLEFRGEGSQKIFVAFFLG